MADHNQTGDSIEAENARWAFDKKVTDNFDAHVEKSVPLYHLGHELVAQVSDFFLPRDSLCYELGCSTGALTAKLAERNRGKKVRFVGIDHEAEMITRATERCRDLDEDISLECKDILDVDFEPCDMVVAYYTVQFIRPRNRQILIDRIYQSLNWGGALLMFEKVRGPDARFQDMFSALYTDYKLNHGYSPENIVAKARSLKGVLEPFSTQGNLDLLQRAGFVDITSIMKYVCFEGFLAIK
jgi:tRNA (cmo5U34)-methyltransferase